MEHMIIWYVKIWQDLTLQWYLTFCILYRGGMITKRVRAGFGGEKSLSSTVRAELYPYECYQIANLVCAVKRYKKIYLSIYQVKSLYFLKLG